MVAKRAASDGELSRQTGFGRFERKEWRWVWRFSKVEFSL